MLALGGAEQFRSKDTVFVYLDASVFVKEPVLAYARICMIFSCSVVLLGCAATRSNVSTMSVDWLVRQEISGCNARAMQGFRGQHFTVLADIALSGQLRVLRPGQDLTSDVSHQRLNVQVDNDGRMLRLFCG
jgi:hypothetical protein